MKRLALAVMALLLLALGGCSVLLPSQYTQISAHSAAQTAHTDSDIPLVSDYQELKRAILQFAEDGISHGVIRTANYTGDVETDLSRAAYSVAREDPVGAYTIDFLTHDCSLIVSYYEITIDITFRGMAEDPRTLEYVTNQKEVETLLRGAMDEYRDHVTWYAVSSHIYNYETLARQICEAEPLHYMAVPEIHAANYPEEGRSRIVELTLTWPADAASLQKMEKAVEESLQAASVYVRYRDTEWEKAGLLYTYLMERFTYTEQRTATPLYSALCEGLITSRSAATAWKLLCDQIGIDCQIVEGSHDGEEYAWNIVTLDGLRYHVDLLRDLLADGSLHLRYDEEMIGYSWDAAQYPVCPKPEPETPAEPQPEEPADGQSGEETPSEDQPADETPAEPLPAEPETTEKNTHDLAHRS